MKSLLHIWWLSAIKALLLLVFGIICLIRPLETAEALAMWLGLLLVIDGVFTLGAVTARWKLRDDRWMLLIDALFGLALGGILLAYPQITLMVIVICIAGWFVLTGLFRIMQAVAIRREIEGEGWLIVGGMLQMLFGSVLVFYPDLVIGTLTVVFGIFATLSGIILLVVALRFRNLFRNREND